GRGASRVIEAHADLECPGRSTHPDSADLTFQSRRYEVLEEALDPVPADMGSGPAMRTLVEVQHGIVGESVQQWFIVPGVESLQGAAELSAEQHRQTRTDGHGDGRADQNAALVHLWAPFRMERHSLPRGEQES